MNEKQTNTGGLAKFLNLKIGAKMMLTVNLEIQDRLINDQAGNIIHIEFAQSSVQKVYVKSSVQKVYVKFSDEEPCLKAIRSSYLGRWNS